MIICEGASILIEVRGLGYSYPGTNCPVLKEVDITVSPGEFVLVMGRSGSGKSTLARALCRLVPDFYGGHMSGQVLYKGRDLREWEPRQISAEIAMLFQEAGQQIIYNQVERDIAFGLENLGIEPSVMKRRVVEAMDFFGLNNIRDKNPAELSGGELRRVALAGVLVMQPKVLILDEPSCQLDPLAAEELLNWLKKLNAEMGTTIILVEQRLDKAFPLADRVLLLEQGRLIYDGIPSRQPVWAKGDAYPLIPTISYIMSDLPAAELPLTVKEGRGIIRERMQHSASGPFGDGEMPEPASGSSADQVMVGPLRSQFIHALKPPWRRFSETEFSLLNVHGLYYGYSRKSDFFENLNMEIAGGESVVLLGANGAGKTTLLRLISGILQPRRGRIIINHAGAYEGERRELCAYLPQSVEDFFLRDTVLEEIQLSLDKRDGDPAFWLELMGISGLKELDPRKLSVGEKQRVALACLLASDREILLLDEPTTGVDTEWRGRIADCLQLACVEQGKTIITVTHDMEFASEIASRVLFMHSGEIISDNPAADAFADNIYYASQAARLFRGFDDTVYKPSQARSLMARLIDQED